MISNEERIDLVHRHEQGAQLENGTDGERPVALSSEGASMLENFVAHVRDGVTDDHGRDPLFTTTQGRMHRSTLRGIIYRMTAPCFRGDLCRDCERTDDRKCPEAVSPHAVRRGSSTHFLSEDVPVEIVCDRTDVSRDMLDTQ